MYHATLTLFNYHPPTNKWYTTVFQNADLIVNESASNTAHGTQNGDAAEIIIHTAADRSVVLSSGKKQYLGPKAFAKCAEPGACFTFTPEKDFFVVGDLGSEPVADDDDTDLYHTMNDENDEVYMVTKATFYQLLPHFEIGGG